MGMEYFDKYEIYENAEKIGSQAIELLDVRIVNGRNGFGDRSRSNDATNP